MTRSASMAIDEVLTAKLSFLVWRDWLCSTGVASIFSSIRFFFPSRGARQKMNVQAEPCLVDTSSFGLRPSQMATVFQPAHEACRQPATDNESWESSQGACKCSPASRERLAAKKKWPMFFPGLLATIGRNLRASEQLTQIQPRVPASVFRESACHRIQRPCFHRSTFPSAP